MAFGRSAITKNRNSWGPISVPSGFHRPAPDEEFAEECTERMMTAQMKQLDPLKEDLADWLNKTLDCRAQWCTCRKNGISCTGSCTCLGQKSCHNVKTPVMPSVSTDLIDDDGETESDDEVQIYGIHPLLQHLHHGIDYINRDNFLTELDNGVVLCHLAQVICESAKQAITSGLVKGTVPTVRGKCFEKAMRRSFFSRDNMENFIKFCRSLGVHENLLFESDDLVLHNQPRNVILCLLEVARIATKYGVEPPGLVQLEKEIAEEERNNSGDSGLSSLLSWQFQASPPRLDSSDLKMRHSSSASAISSYDRWNTGPHVILLPERGSGDNGMTSLPAVTASGASDGVPSDNTEDEEWSRGSGEDPDLDIVDTPRRPSSGGGGDTPTPTTELDRKVQLATRLMQRNCNCANGKCDKLKVRKVGEGKYNIAGKNVFIRLLKGRHMMVRVGGGWDTLDHFLLRHDPCQVKVVSRDSPDRPASASKYLHIRAKYRSPPPRESVTR